MGRTKCIIANTWSRLRIVGMFMLIAASPALAATGDTPRQPLAGGGLLVILAIVYHHPKRADDRLSGKSLGRDIIIWNWYCRLKKIIVKYFQHFWKMEKKFFRTFFLSSSFVPL